MPKERQNKFNDYKGMVYYNGPRDVSRMCILSIIDVDNVSAKMCVIAKDGV